MLLKLKEEFADINRQHEASEYEWERYEHLKAKVALSATAADQLQCTYAEQFVARVRQRYERHRAQTIAELRQKLAILRETYVMAEEQLGDIDELDWQVGLLLFEAEDWSEDA